MKSIKKFLKCGPGGTSCHCCFPPSGTKRRRYEYRRAKREEKKAALKTYADNG